MKTETEIIEITRWRKINNKREEEPREREANGDSNSKLEVIVLCIGNDSMRQDDGDTKLLGG